jgi:Right handed beta helix region/Periplasmic copper-binding protein (NosD)
MKLPLPRSRRAQIALAAVVLVGALATLTPWLDGLRPSSPDDLLRQRFRVTSAGDTGPGSLREAIFAADRAGRAARIELDVPRIVLQSPLPPLLNPNGIVIDGMRARTQIVSHQAGGAVFDVSAPHSSILGVRITGSVGPAVLARSSDFKVRGITIENSAVGIFLVDGAGQLSVTDSSFRRNVVGIHLSGGIRQITIQNNTFEGHRNAAIWAVAPKPHEIGGAVQIDVIRNRFAADVRPVVLFNVSARVDDNAFQDAHHSAVHVSGATVAIRRNRVREGRGFGAEVVGVSSGLIASNEIDHNCAGGVLVRGSANTQILSNRIYANGSGIVIVSGSAVNPSRVTDNLVARNQLDGLHLIGASPLVERNQLLQNQRAGLRISRLNAGRLLDQISRPELASNTLEGNGSNEQTDTYDPGRSDTETSPADCAWRIGRPAGPVASRVN